MAVGAIVDVWREGGQAFACVRVGAVEYAVQTPLRKTDGGTKTPAELKTDLAAEVTARRAVGRQAVSGVSGAVTV